MPAIFVADRHQIGTYPIADATTASQEPMPMENTGNMFLMLAGIVQRTPGASHDWLRPYMPMLTNWAEYLISTLPYPAEQLCTDDFTGKLANNTNLAAKGIVALEAFSHLCTASGGSGCARYSDAATGFVKTWIQEGLEQKPAPHYKIAYNFPNSYSIKYAPHFSRSSHLSRDLLAGAGTTWSGRSCSTTPSRSHGSKWSRRRKCRVI